MARKSKGKSYVQQSQMSKEERVGALIEQKKAEQEKELEKDERVQKKLQELDEQKQVYEELIGKNDSVLQEERDKLQEEYDLLKLGLDDEKKAIDKSRDEVLSLREDIQKEKEDLERIRELVRNEEIEKIRRDEKSIREEEYKKLLQDVEKKRKSEQKKIDSEREKLQNAAIKAEEERREKLQSDDQEILKRHEALSEEYKEKKAELSKLKIELMSMQEDVKVQKQDLEETEQYFLGLRSKYGADPIKTIDKLTRNEELLKTRIEALQESLAELTQENAELLGRIRDDSGESLIRQINNLTLELEETKKRADELTNMPSMAEIEQLRRKALELEDKTVALDEERRKREEAERKLSGYALGVMELENARVTAAALESMNNQLMVKLKQISEQYKETQESKFKTLLEIDQEMAGEAAFIGKPFGKDLKTLVKYIRMYGAGKKENPLYYSEETIRVFLASIATSEPASRLLILQGLSGTGKSSLPRLVAEAIGAECKLVAVQPSWRDNRELLGYDNDFTNRFKETEFTKYLYKASIPKNQNCIYFIVLDEMNLARIEYYFADFLSTLEKPNQQEWIIPLVSGYSEVNENQKPGFLNYDNEAASILVTKNIWFIGTANNDDSTSMITDKVYDRAQIMDMDSRETEFEAKCIPPLSIELDELHSMFEEAELTEKYCMNSGDWDKIKEIDEFCLKDMDITFGNRIKKQMEYFVPVYVACGGTKEGAIDYLLTHKILRKLDERYEPFLVKHLDNLLVTLNDTYGDNVFVQSIEKIKKLKERINPGD